MARKNSSNFFLDKIVVITGAGSGIGLACAWALAREGALVHLVDIDGQRLEKATGEMRDQGLWVQPHHLDCAQEKEMQALAENIFAAHKRVDILYNNAGVCVGGAAHEISSEDWRWSFDVNLWSVVHAIRAFVPEIITQGGGGQIVITASIAGLLGLPFTAPYCASKFALVGLSESLACDLAEHGISVTLICPGAVKTNVLKDGRIKLPGAWQEKIPLLTEQHAKNPDVVAQKILKALKRKKNRLVVAAGVFRPLFWIRGLSPALYVRIMTLVTRLALHKK